MQAEVLKKGAKELDGYADQFVEALDKAIQNYRGEEAVAASEGESHSIGISDSYFYNETGTE